MDDKNSLKGKKLSGIFQEGDLDLGLTQDMNFPTTSRSSSPDPMNFRTTSRSSSPDPRFWGSGNLIQGDDLRAVMQDTMKVASEFSSGRPFEVSYEVGGIKLTGKVIPPLQHTALSTKSRK